MTELLKVNVKFLPDNEVEIWFDTDGPGFLTLERHMIINRKFLIEIDNEYYLKVVLPGHPDSMHIENISPNQLFFKDI